MSKSKLKGSAAYPGATATAMWIDEAAALKVGNAVHTAVDMGVHDETVIVHDGDFIVGDTHLGDMKLWPRQVETMQKTMNKLSKYAFTYGGTRTGRMSSKSFTGATMQPATTYSKRHYEDAARLVCEVDEGLEAAGVDEATRDVMCEVMRARYAMLFATDNPKFDSFRFSNAARRRGAWERPRTRGKA